MKNTIKYFCGIFSAEISKEKFGEIDLRELIKESIPSCVDWMDEDDAISSQDWDATVEDLGETIKITTTYIVNNRNEVVDVEFLTSPKALKLKAMRICKGLSQNQLAILVDAPIKSLQSYEQGIRSINGVSALNTFKLAQVLECKVEDLLQYTLEDRFDYISYRRMETNFEKLKDYINNDKFFRYKFKVPKFVKEIKASSFFADSIIDIDISDNVTEIGENAFGACKFLESVKLSNSITKISKQLFQGCKSLKNITIPNGVTSIEKQAFFDCESLENIIIPDGVTEIGDEAFKNCTNLKNIIIPDSVTKIGSCAFVGCESLESIKLSNSLKRIEDGTFLECAKLKNVKIPDSVEYIGDEAFWGCEKFEISKNVELGEDVFE